MSPAVPAIPPRQPGETAYAYRKRRSVALTGQTPYQRRIAAGIARGQSRQTARGHAPTISGSPGSSAALSEYQRRNQQSIATTGQTLYQRRNAVHDAWLTANGYTPATTGLSWTALRRIRLRLEWINQNTSPGGSLTPGLIQESVDYERNGEYPRGFVVDRIFKRYQSMLNFLNGSNQPGNFYWFMEGGASSAGSSAAAWWYYH